MMSYDEDGLCVSVCAPYNQDIEEYMEKLLIRGRKEITVHRYRCVLLAFCRNLRELGKSDDPNGVRILTNHETPTAKWISYDELVRSMAAASTKAEVLMLYLGGNYGLRRGEISRLKVDDVKRGYMIIHGKGHGPDGKVRHIPLVADEDPMISEYPLYRENLVSFCDVDETDGSLLVFRKKKVAKSYTPEHVGRRCKDIMNSVGVDGTTHSLRREFITTAYRADAQLLDIMRIVGHTDPRQTVRYIENDMEYMRQTIQLRKLYISSSIITYIEEDAGLRNLSYKKGEGKRYFLYRKCLKPKPFKKCLFTKR